MVLPRPVLLAGGALIALLALWVMCGGAAASAAGSNMSRCPELSRTLDCALTPAIAHISDSEAEEPEEELEEGAEEAASAEAEAESEEEGSQSGSLSDHAGATGAIVLSKLRLTARASAALARDRPSASAIDFSFTLSAPSQVRVTLVEQVSDHGRERWTQLPDSLTLNEGGGRVSHNLAGHNHLSPGRYRLTVAPLAGRSRSIYLSTRR